MTKVERYSAFSDQPGGGNPAGVVLDATGLDADAMQAIATEVGYSETAFLVRRDGPAAFAVRYFSPLAEVPFCGHATVATGVALARRDGPGARETRDASRARCRSARSSTREAGSPRH